jgi:CheY-like chemotaxis protein
VSSSSRRRVDMRGPRNTDRVPRWPSPRPLVDRAASRAAGALAGLRILLVEDEPDARYITTRFLEAQSARVVAAANGVDALQLLDAMGLGPHLVVTDLRMPDLDGYGLARRLQADRRWRQVPVIALTAFAGTADYVRTLEHGFAAHLGKPVDDAVLAGTIQRVLGRHRAA